MPPAAHRRWLALTVVLAAECMDLLDGTIVNVAAPTIHADLHASSTALQWIVGGYPLALAVGLLVGGRLGDVIGRRTAFIAGLIVFTACSTVCGLAPSTSVLVAARLAQGIGGALMLPQGLGIIRQLFGEQDAAKAFGLFGPVLGSAAMVGPIIGGGIVALNLFGTHWRPVFLINVPIGLIALVVALRALPPAPSGRTTRLDLGGAGLAGLASLAIVYPLIQGRELGWPTWTYASIAGGVGLFGALAVHLRRRARRGADPLIEPGIFARRGFSAGVLVMMLFFGGMVAAMLTLTLFLQLGEHYSAIHAGLTLVPFALGTAITAPAGGALLSKVSGRTLIQAGGTLSALGYAAAAVIVSGGGTISTWALAGPLLIVGMGMGFFVTAGFDTVLSAVSDAQTGSASGVLNAVQQLGASIGVAAIGTLFFSVLRSEGFGPALTHSLWWQVGLLAATVALTPLLPVRVGVTPFSVAAATPD